MPTLLHTPRTHTQAGVLLLLAGVVQLIMGIVLLFRMIEALNEVHR